mgnify:CR=1 FL=1
MTIERFFAIHLYRLVKGKDGKPKLEKYRVKEGYKTYEEAKRHARHADGYNIQSYAIIKE